MDAAGEIDGDPEYADEAGPSAGGTCKRDLGIVVGVMAVFVAVLWLALAMLPDGESAEPGDLATFDEIELGGLAGADANIGVTRSAALPIVVHGSGSGETSIQIVDVVEGTVTDAGPIPVDGWATNVFPRASDAYVAVLATVCAGKPVEGDAGDECPTQAVDTVLAVYDIADDSWATLPVDDALASQIGLVDVDGATATLERSPSLSDEPSLWSTVALDKPLALGPLSTDGKPKPNGLIESRGHFDGWGWKASGASGWEDDTTWTGDVQGRSTVELIANVPDRSYSGAGPCLVIATTHRRTLQHLHEVCSA